MRPCALRAFDFDVDRSRAGVDRRVQNLDLLLHTAIEMSAILMPAACGEYGALGILGQKSANGFDTLLRSWQVVQTKFQERFSRIRLLSCARQKFFDRRKTQGYANLRKSGSVGH